MKLICWITFNQDNNRSIIEKIILNLVDRGQICVGSLVDCSYRRSILTFGLTIVLVSCDNRAVGIAGICSNSVLLQIAEKIKKNLKFIKFIILGPESIEESGF